MINYQIGNIIDSPAECLVNTVNCEGFMGKGIAYQFKLKFPENEKAYQQACRKKEIQIGKVFLYRENGKLIANFPTKDEWRKNSEYSYIQSGMADLAQKIQTHGIKSVAIPPLGCGNGGLEWHTVKEIIVQSLASVDNGETVFTIFEPSHGYKTTPTRIPKLTFSHLLLLLIKNNLQRFSKFRLQKTAYFTCLFTQDEFFKFEEQDFGPYSHAIDICSRSIKEFQDYYNISSAEAEVLARKNLISGNVQKQLDKFDLPLHCAANLVNSIPDDSTLEIIVTLISIVQKQPGIDEAHIMERFYSWSEKKKRHSTQAVLDVFHNLLEQQMVSVSLVGYELGDVFSGQLGYEVAYNNE